MVIELNNAACISTGRTILVAKQPAKNKPISETPELGVKAFNWNGLRNNFVAP